MNGNDRLIYATDNECIVSGTYAIFFLDNAPPQEKQILTTTVTLLWIPALISLLSSFFLSMRCESFAAAVIMKYGPDKLSGTRFLVMWAI